MKQVFELYGSSVIAGMLATTIFFILFNGNFFGERGLGGVLGYVLEYSIGGNNAGVSAVFQKYMSDAAPTIEKKENHVVCVNEQILFSEYFEAKSSKGEHLPVYLHRVWKLDGEEIDLGKTSDRTSICFSEAGVYWLQLCATDSNQKETSVVVKLLVNER